MRFGLPTMPAELSLYLLNFVDRIILVRSAGLRRGRPLLARGQVRPGVNVLVRGFQLAWPPLAYSIRDDDEARRAYAVVVTWFVAVCAFVVTGMWLLARWIVRALAAPEFFGSYEAIGLVATAVTLYALYMVLVVVLGRTGRTEFNFPATLAGPGRQHRPQPRPGPAARDRRRRRRPRRLLHRRAGADVRLHPAPLPGALRMGAPAAGARSSRPRWSAAGELLLPTEGFVGLVGRDRLWLALTRWPCSPPASSPRASARWLARLRHPVRAFSPRLAGPAPGRGRRSTAGARALRGRAARRGRSRP